MTDIYRRLAAHLDKLSIPFPSTEDNLELKLLKVWFDPKEAEIALNMTPLPEPVAVIARRMGESAEQLAPVLKKMSHKGLIFRAARHETRKNDHPEWLYNLVPMAEGMWEFHMNSTHEDEVEMVNEYIEFFMESSWYKTDTSQHRVVPISKSIQAGFDILPYDHAEKIIRSQTKISVAHCICRKQAQMLGKGCDHPSEVCLAFGTGAYYYIENGLGREVSQEEALDILRTGMEAGLVLQPGNGQRVWGICMCCTCGCQLLRALKKMPKPARMAHTNFNAVCSDTHCTACGTCVDLCPMEAIEIIENAASVNIDRCIGCGVCVASCDFDAIALHQKSAKEHYTPPKDIVEMHKRVAAERITLRGKHS